MKLNDISYKYVLFSFSSADLFCAFVQHKRRMDLVPMVASTNIELIRPILHLLGCFGLMIYVHHRRIDCQITVEQHC